MALLRHLDEYDVEAILELARQSHTKTGMRTSDYCICGEVGSSNGSALCRLLEVVSSGNF